LNGTVKLHGARMSDLESQLAQGNQKSAPNKKRKRY
jgi:hypothetical protein